MSIALESSSSSRIGRSAFARRISPCISIFEDSKSGMKVGRGIPAEDRRPSAGRGDSNSCSSSSIGRNSDYSGNRMSDGEDSGEVQSPYKGPLDTMYALEEVLPIRRGVSKFYRGKSKSFTNLAEASSSCLVKDLGKPDNAHSRKRKNLPTCSNIPDKNQNYPLRNCGGGISKRHTNSLRSTLAVAVTMSSSEINLSEDHEPRLLPLQPPQWKSPMNVPPSQRSFSLTDLQAAMARSSICPRDKHKKVH